MESDNLVNTHLGQYHLQAKLGQGGMGAVYRGYDPRLERYVAVKVLASHLAWQDDFVERFMREARAAAKLKHPAIVTIHDVGQDSERYYFVMEYVEGPTLTDVIQQRGPLPPDEALAILRPLAQALDYAHQQGLVHRDVKPANVILGPRGSVKLTDFGIVRATRETRLTSTGTIMGTAEYMSPEQAQGLTVGAHTDQYSLAVVAYEMLSGQVPFQAPSTMAVLYKVTHEAPPPLSQARPDLPPGVEAVLERALSKEPGDRFPTVTAFVQALEQALTGRVAGAPVRRRVPIWAWIIGSLALLALVGGSLVALRGGGKSTPTPRQTAVVAATPSTPTPIPSTPTTPAPTLSTPTPDAAATDAAATLIAAATTVSAPTPTSSPTRPPAASATPTPTPFDSTPIATETPQPTETSAVAAVVLSGGAELRPGADTWWFPRQTLPAGTELELAGRDPDFEDWVYVRTLDGQTSGWTQVENLDLRREWDDLPVVTTVPTLTPESPTPTAQPPTPGTCEGGALRLDAWPVNKFCTASGWTATIFVEGHGGNCSYTYAWEREYQGGPISGSMTFDIQSAGFGNSIVGQASVTSAGETVVVGLQIEPPDCP